MEHRQTRFKRRFHASNSDVAHVDNQFTLSLNEYAIDYIAQKVITQLMGDI